VTSTEQEVLTVNVSLTRRPSTLPAAWAHVCGVRVGSAYGVAHDLLVGQPSVQLMAAHAPQLPQVHQVSCQAVQAQARVQTVQMAGSDGTNGTTGFLGGDMAAVKQIVARVSGAPPRGRPV
jgi:hypothetical protein